MLAVLADMTVGSPECVMLQGFDLDDPCLPYPVTPDSIHYRACTLILRLPNNS